MPNIISILQKHSVKKTSNAYLFLGDGLQETVSITYLELDKKARALAVYLKQRTVAGQRVLLLFPSGINFITAFFGCLYAGIIAVPLFCSKENEFEKLQNYFATLARDVDASGILTDSDFYSLLKDSEFVNKNVFIGNVAQIDAALAEQYSSAMIYPDTIAYLQYTSGSTSAPKAAVIRHQNLIHNIKYTGLAWHYGRKSISLTFAPHAHVYGLVCGLLMPLYYGSLAIFMPPYAFLQQPILWLKAISKYRVSHSGCPNFGYDLCNQAINELEMQGINLNSWKVAVNGGEKIHYESLMRFANKFKPYGFDINHFCTAYGMSEMSGTISAGRYGKKPTIFHLNAQELANHKIVAAKRNEDRVTAVSNGYLLPGLIAKIVDPISLKPVSKGRVGEIWVSGASLVSGYWQASDAEKNVCVNLPGSKNNFFRTGDLGFIKKNEICVTGRLKEVIIRYGKNYYPQDLERSIENALRHITLNKCIVFSSCIDVREEIFVIQEIDPAKINVDYNDIINLIRREITTNHGLEIHGIILVNKNSLPKTLSGKLQRKLCQELFAQKKLEPFFTHYKNETLKLTETKGALKSWILDQRFVSDFKNMIASALKINVENIDLDLQVSMYGLDSINIVQFINLFNNTYKLSLTPEVMYEYTTLRKFLQDISAKYSSNLIAYYSASGVVTTPMSAQKKSIPDINPHQVQNTHDIAIIGMSGVFPGAENTSIFWDNIFQGRDAISEIPKERWDFENVDVVHYQDASTVKIKWGGFIKNIKQFDASFFNISPREAELTDPQQRIFLQTVWKTIEDAGYSINEISKKKVGLFVGVFGHDYSEILQQQGITDAYVTTGTTHSILANRVSYLLNLQGPSEAIDTACSSSLVAIHHAIQAIKNGDCHLAIAGGVNALLSPSNYLAATRAGMLSIDGRCKTFDKEANGYVRAEGSAAILLKPLYLAEKEGDHIYGIIKGSAVNHGGHVSSLTVPNPSAQADVIVNALQRAQIPIDTVSYIEAHGTGTSLGDPIEITGLKKAFNTLADQQGINVPNYSCGLGSVKTLIGHLEAGAGIASVIKVLLSMKHKKLVGNLHFNELNPYINLTDTPFYIVDKSQPWMRRIDKNKTEIPLRAGISSFGFGGTNAHIILEEAYSSSQKISAKISSHPLLIAISAKTEMALEEKISQLHNWLINQEELPSIESICYTLNIGRDHFDKRCSIVVENISEFINTLDELIHTEFNTGSYPSNVIINIDNRKTALQPAFEELCENLINEIKSNHISVSDCKSKLMSLGNFFAEGYELNWQRLHSGERKRVSLPSYPFAKENYWVPADKITTLFDSTIENMNEQEGGVLEIEHRLINYISDLLKIDSSKINVTTPLGDSGLDSISLKELTFILEKSFNLEITPSIFFAHNTIKALSKYLYNELSIRVKKIIQPASKGRIEKYSLEPVAIIGMQGYLPQSEDLRIFWRHLIEENDLITEVPKERWDWHKYYGDSKNDITKTNSKWGGFIKDFDTFDASFFNISSREANLMDPQHRLFLEIVWKTIEDAGYNPLALSEQDVGLFVGVEFSEYQTLISQNKIFHGHVSTGNSHALLANRISYFLNLHGPSEVISTSCSSSLVAVHRGFNALQNNECGMVIAGGVSLMLSPETFVVTSQLGALSPDGRCKTFDRSANGYVKGEGVAAILLKRLNDAKKDGDYIYGVIKGSAVNHGGKARSLTAPNVNSQSQLLIKAYTQAGVDPATVTYIETHGTATELGDPAEIEGLKLAFSKLMSAQNKPDYQKQFCALGSVKTNIGHLEPASGIVGLIKVMLAMKHEKIPGNLHQNELNPFIKLSDSPFYIIKKTQDWPRLQDSSNNLIARRAGISSFGFGGTCAHIVVEEAISDEHNINDTLPPYFLVTLSAKQIESLEQKIIDLHEWLENNLHEINLSSLSFTLNSGRAHFEHRVALVVNSARELLSLLSDRHTVISKATAVSCAETTDEAYKADINNSLSVEDYRQELLTVAKNYLSGKTIDWNSLYTHKQRVAFLPSYPFMKKRYWFDFEITNNNQTVFESQPINAHTDLEQLTLNYLRTIFAEKLRLTPEQILVNETYEIYGIDSLLSLEITTRLEQDFGTLPKTLLYEKPQLSLLVKYFQKNFEDKLKNMFTGSNKIDLPTSEIKTQVSNFEFTHNAKRNSQDIAVIGMSINFPLAKNLREFWNNLVAGLDCITEIPVERWDYRDYPIGANDEKKYFRYGGFIPDVDKFDPLFFNISPREAMLMDPQERLFLQTAWSTIEDAGYTRESLKRTVDNKVGVFAGATYNFYPLLIAQEWQKGNQLPLDIQMFSIANRVSYFLNLNGPSFVVDTACSSSLAAIHLACESILRGECAAAIAGGVNLSLHPAKYHFLGGYNFLSEKGRCLSFAEGGEGYVPSEGVGAVLLKPLELAMRDNDRIYGVIKSTSMNHGAKTSGYTVPSPSAQTDLIKNALEKANINPRSISYIEAHGTGTSLGDPIEIRGLQDAFEDYTSDKQFCAIGSVKSNIGHLESAAGISQLAKVLLQMQYKKLTPSLHAEKLNPYIDFSKTPFFVQRELSDWNTQNDLRRAGISSFGAGGTNIHVIVEEFISNNKLNTPPSIPLILLLSAANEDRLKEYLSLMYSYLLTEGKYYSTEKLHRWLLDVCYTSQVGRESMASRLSIVAHSYEELLDKIKQYELENSWQKNSINDKSRTQENIDSLIHQRDYQALASVWMCGQKIDWQKIYGTDTPRRIYIPTYPFAKRICWVTQTPIKNEPTVTEEPIIFTENKVNIISSPQKIAANNSSELVLEFLLILMAKLLELDPDEIEVDAPFLNYGMDSIIGINFVVELDKKYPETLSPMDLYRYPTAKQLANYISQSCSVDDEESEFRAAEFPDEGEFLAGIDQLNAEQVNKLLEHELMELDAMLAAM